MRISNVNLVFPHAGDVEYEHSVTEKSKRYTEIGQSRGSISWVNLRVDGPTDDGAKVRLALARRQGRDDTPNVNRVVNNRSRVYFLYVFRV